MLHLYLVKPVGGGQQIGETCRPKCNTKTEQALLLSIASKQRNRIRQLAQWLTDHPEAASLLRDTKGKGKSKARDDGQNDVAMKEKAHFERCLEEVESRQRLKELIASTNDWVTCFKSRLEAVRNAKKMLIALQEGQERISRVDSPPSKKQKRPSSGVTTVEVQVPRNTKRRRTVDRGTSPIQEIVERSIYLEQSREYEQDEGSAVIFEHPVANGPIHPASLAQETALQEDDSPPSPQSLPSPPPHAQVRQKQLQNVTDESQQSTTDSSFKPPSLPSVQSLPPVQSSSSADDGFRTIVIREINSVVHDTGVEKQTDSTTEMVAHKVKKPKKRISKVPPIAPEIQLLLEKAALKAEKKRQEEKEAIGAPVEDHWQGLQEWVPPDNQIGPAVEPETTHSGEQRQDNESSMSGEMTGAMYTARSHVVSFEALEADGSSLASQERREREEMEAAGIQEFLKSEDL